MTTRKLEVILEPLPSSHKTFDLFFKAGKQCMFIGTVTDKGGWVTGYNRVEDQSTEAETVTLVVQRMLSDMVPEMAHLLVDFGESES